MIQKCYIPRTLAKYKTIRLPDNADGTAYTCRIIAGKKILYTPHDPFKIEKNKK